MMKHKDSAAFLQSLAKRARKYYLGLTTISQDIEDFLNSEEGIAIMTNSSIQILMKQSATAIDKLAAVFYLSEGEQNLLLSANVGEGLFFAGESHVAMQVVASMKEHQLVTTNPAELQMMEKQKEIEAAEDKIGRIQSQQYDESPFETITENPISTPEVGSVTNQTSTEPLTPQKEIDQLADETEHEENPTGGNAPSSPTSTN